MVSRIRRLLAPQEVPAWDRNKVLLGLGATSLAGLVLVGGLVLAISYSLQGANDGKAASRVDTSMHLTAGSTSTGANVADAQTRADALAALPMLSLGPDAAQPAPVSTRDPGTIVIPQSTGTGPAGVPTGFPRTPQGALAQLAALDQAAMQTASMSGVRAAIASWAAPGGPTPQTWSGVTAMAAFLTAAGLSGGGSPQLALVVTPLMGQIKGSVGAGVAVVCVDFEFDATLAQTSRVAVAVCQKMVWQQTRWVIGPGAEAATAPSVWPDTDTAFAAGYKDLRRG